GLIASRHLALRQVEYLAEDLAEALRRERSPVRAGQVAEHPLLALGIDEREPARFLVVLQPRDELQPGVDRFDDRAVGIGDLLAQLADHGIVVLLRHVLQYEAKTSIDVVSV